MVPERHGEAVEIPQDGPQRAKPLTAKDEFIAPMTDDVHVNSEVDEDMATMLMSMRGAWIGEDGVQQGFPSQEGGPRLIRFESPRWRPKAI
jgi:hypothetical protein